MNASNRQIFNGNFISLVITKITRVDGIRTIAEFLSSSSTFILEKCFRVSHLDLCGSWVVGYIDGSYWYSGKLRTLTSWTKIVCFKCSKVIKGGDAIFICEKNTKICHITITGVPKEVLLLLERKKGSWPSSRWHWARCTINISKFIDWSWYRTCFIPGGVNEKVSQRYLMHTCTFLKVIHFPITSKTICKSWISSPDLSSACFSCATEHTEQ